MSSIAPVAVSIKPEELHFVFQYMIWSFNLENGGRMSKSIAAVPLLVALAYCGIPHIAVAQDGINSLQRGDIIHLDIDYDLTRWIPAEQTAESGKVCFKRGSKFEVVRIAAKETILRRRDRWTLGPKAREALRHSCDEKLIDVHSPSDSASLYTVVSEEFSTDYYRHFGITHGALFVPFKRRSDKSLSGESNLGYYLGYRFGGPFGVAITPAASVGMSLVNVSDDSAITANSVRDSGTRAAFTWSVGFILTHLNAFQVGVFVGKDQIGGDAGTSWKYEDQTWTSVAFGYPFGK